MRNPYEENTKEADDKLWNNNINVSASDIHIESDNDSAMQNPYTFEPIGTSPNKTKWLTLQSQTKISIAKNQGLLQF